jgi:hypothetical protein
VLVESQIRVARCMISKHLTMNDLEIQPFRGLKSNGMAQRTKSYRLTSNLAHENYPRS